MIETCFGRIENLETVIREPSSIASKRGRMISSLEAMPRMTYGHRFDLVFGLYDVGYSIPLRVRSNWVLHSGFACTMIELECPAAYISRLKRYRTVEISNDISQFCITVLTALMFAWTCCAIMKEVVDTVSPSDQNINTKDTSWLDKCLATFDIPVTPMISLSTEPTGKKQTNIINSLIG
ncbi:MAG: hypothetical protein EXX96DRAFT_538613 [Benjaminiella poitrasii]|nr:MAG: hypothetical protein EXX96DRAFT_538613 [Benjaminiella poitrasii]